MTIAYPSCPSLTVLFFALAHTACSSDMKKNGVDAAQPGDSTVLDASAGRPNLTTNLTSLIFPVLCPGQSSAPETLQVINNGDSAVPVNVKVAEGDAADFTATATDCDLIGPGASCTVAVVFTQPTALGARTATLEVTSAAFTGWGLTIALESFSTGGPAPFSISPSSSDLGSVAVGTTGPAVTLTLTVVGHSGSCSGPDPLVPFTVTLSSAEFIATDDTCSTNVIPIGGTCTINVVFRPTSIGSKSAALIVALPSFNRTVGLTGAGISIIDAGPSESVDSGLEQGEAGNIQTDLGSGYR